jgi:hypothetical protein
MTTMDVPTLGEFATLRMAKFFAKRQAREANHAGAWIQTVVRLVFHLAGFSCLTYAGFLWHPAAGFVVAGLSFFLLSWVTTSNQPASARPTHGPQPDPLTYGSRKG